MQKRKIIRISIAVVLFVTLAIGATVLYLFNMPHRDVQSTQTDFSLASNEIVLEYLKDAEAANIKYLSDEGESKVLEVKGKVSDISEDFNNQMVVLLKETNDNAGVSCTLLPDENNKLNIKVGEMVVIKGVIRSGASFDSDLDMYENVIMENCKLIK